MKIIKNWKNWKNKKFLKSVYGEEIFDEKVDKLSKKNLKNYVKIYKMV